MRAQRCTAVFRPRARALIALAVATMGCAPSAPSTAAPGLASRHSSASSDALLVSDASTSTGREDAAARAEPATPEPATAAHPQLLDAATPERVAPERFTVLFTTSAGELTLDVRRSWAPHSADRLYTLVKLGYFEGVAFHHVGSGKALFGIHPEPAVTRIWHSRVFTADPVVQTNIRGMVSFARDTEGHATQLLLNLADNSALDREGFAPLGRVRELDTAQRLFGDYGEPPPRGHGPSPNRAAREGAAYLRVHFPRLDTIERAVVADEKPLPGSITP